MQDSFATDNGWGWAELHARVARLHWLRPDAAALGNEAIREFLREGFASIEGWAAQRGIAVGTAFSEILAHAPTADLPLYRALLAAPSLLPPGVSDSFEPDARARLQSSPSIAFIENLASGEDIDDEDVLAFLDPMSVRAVEWHVGSRLREDRPVGTAALVGIVFRSTAGRSARFQLQLIKRAAHVSVPRGGVTGADTGCA